MFSNASEQSGQLETTRAALADAHAMQLEKAESDASSLRVKQQHSTTLLYFFFVCQTVRRW